MKQQSIELIENLISKNIDNKTSEHLLSEYLKNRRLNNSIVFKKIELEYKTLEYKKFVKLIYLPYSINPDFKQEEESEYSKLLLKCFNYYSDRLSIDNPNLKHIWILSIIADVLFHLYDSEKYLDISFVNSCKKVLELNLQNIEYEILTDFIQDILTIMNTHEAKELLQSLDEKTGNKSED